MHDFRKSVFQSALWLKDISQETFSWSAAKHKLFYACRRAYLIRYYIAQGGGDADASAIARRAFTEKYLLTFSAWLNGMMTESLSDALLHIRNQPKHRRRDELIKALKLRLSHRIFLADAFLRAKEYLRDPKKLSLYELYYQTEPIRSAEDLVAESKQVFRRFFAYLPESALLERILETDPLSWRLPPVFLQMQCGQIPVFLRPRLYAFDCGTVLSLELDFKPASEDHSARGYQDTDDSLPDSLFASYAAKYGENPQLECRFFSQIGEDFLEDSFSPAPADEALIRDSAAEMLRTLPVSVSSMEHFPCEDVPEKCSLCRFQGTCAYLKCNGF